MRRALATSACELGVVALVITVLLFGASPGSWLSRFSQQVNGICLDPEIHRGIFLALGSYGVTFVFFRSQGRKPFQTRPNIVAALVRSIPRSAQAHRLARQGRYGHPSAWLGVGVLACVAVYLLSPWPSIQALILLFGVVLGQAFGLWAGTHARQAQLELNCATRVCCVVIWLVLLLTVASTCQSSTKLTFQYLGRSRLSGPWDNPNSFGLLMGVGTVLALGLTARSCYVAWGRSDFGRISYLGTCLCAVASALLLRGLYHSFSRGAWIGTFSGLSFLVGSALLALSSERNPEPGIGSTSSQISLQLILSRCRVTGILVWFRKNLLVLTIIAVSLGTICCWHFRQTEWPPARRLFSVLNNKDFSWRNRIAAYEGALQIIAEHPWLGAGWGQPAPLYEHYYILPKLTESAAIEVNDYLMLAATLGIPGLVAFGMYFWLSLAESSGGTSDSFESKHPDALRVTWLPATCRAGAIVLLVGFWFDGGLFRLATGCTFWILLALGSASNCVSCQTRQNA